MTPCSQTEAQKKELAGKLAQEAAQKVRSLNGSAGQLEEGSAERAERVRQGLYLLCLTAARYLQQWP